MGGAVLYTQHIRECEGLVDFISPAGLKHHSIPWQCVCVYIDYIYISIYMLHRPPLLCPPMLYLNSFRVCVCVFRFYISNIYSLFPSFQLGSKTQRSSNVHITYCPPPSLWTIYSRPAQYIYDFNSLNYIIYHTPNEIFRNVYIFRLYTNFALIIIQYYI